MHVRPTQNFLVEEFLYNRNVFWIAIRPSEPHLVSVAFDLQPNLTLTPCLDG